MSELPASVRKYVESLTPSEERALREHLRTRFPIHPIEAEWGTTAEAILGAIARSGDLTKRGIRGILAEAVFEESVAAELRPLGWVSAPITGDQPFDVLLTGTRGSLRIQVKQQRREAGVPKGYPERSRARLKSPREGLYVVEVQRTRSGKREGRDTRPYRFGDFDLLAVNMQASTGRWDRFMYTPASWLLGRAAHPALVEIFQPVPAAADEYWTDSAERCIDWVLSGGKRSLYGGRRRR
ncbi:MAG: hypothetical protein ACRD13_13670 [Terriglobales bacterium]